MIHVLIVPEHEVRREDAGVKFCFRCRKHLPHTDVLKAPDDPRSYYDPRWDYECSGCGEDHTAFPGCAGRYGA
jgi:hypothetical protein